GKADLGTNRGKLPPHHVSSIRQCSPKPCIESAIPSTPTSVAINCSRLSLRSRCEAQKGSHHGRKSHPTHGAPGRAKYLGSARPSTSGRAKTLISSPTATHSDGQT